MNVARRLPRMALRSSFQCSTALTVLRVRSSTAASATAIITALRPFSSTPERSTNSQGTQKVMFQPRQQKIVYQFDDKTAGRTTIENNVSNRVELAKKFLRGSAIGIVTHATLYCISFGLIYKGIHVFEAHDIVFGWASGLPYVGETIAKYVSEYPQARYPSFFVPVCQYISQFRGD